MNRGLLFKATLATFMAVNLLSFVLAQSPLESSVSQVLCGIVGFIRAIVGVLALALFILGGVLYAVGHFLPAAGQLRVNMQGWAMGLIFAGIVALVLFIIAQPLISTLTGIGSAVGSNTTNAIVCS